jgi:hypothetical protein
MTENDRNFFAGCLIIIFLLAVLVAALTFGVVSVLYWFGVVGG